MTTPIWWADRDRRDVLAFITTVGKHIDPQHVRHVFDLGSRDCAQALELAKAFPNAWVHAFECNPATLPACKAAAATCARVRLVPKAVHDHDGMTSFYVVDLERDRSEAWPDGNPGMSSLFEAAIPQQRVEVPCIRLDTYCREHGIDRIDIVWADMQGAELLALVSLGGVPFDFLHTEVSHQPMYHGGVLFQDLDTWLRTRNMIQLTSITKTSGEEDIDYMHKRMLEIPLTIHHVWAGLNPFPYGEWRQGWMKKHPDATFRFWRGTAPSCDPRFQKLLDDDRYTPVVKADILRWGVLLQEGGVYVDTDMECINGLAPLDLQDPHGCFLAEEEPGRVCTAIVGATAGHPFVKKVVDALFLALEECSPELANQNPVAVTGPNLITRLVQENRDLVTCHPYPRFYPWFYNNQRAAAPMDQAVCNHHWKGSWKEKGPGWREEVARNTGNTAELQVLAASKQDHDTLRIVVVSTGFQSPHAEACRQSVRDQVAPPGVSVTHLYLEASEQPKPRPNALENRWRAIMALHPSDVVVELDGDDKLLPGALAHVAALYHYPSVWITYGSFRFEDGRPGFAAGYEPTENLRKSQWRATHLKTFRAGLFQRIWQKDLLRDDGSWIEHGRDQATMFPMLEMAGPTHRLFVPEVLYIYNEASSHGVMHPSDDQATDVALIRSRPAYKPLASLGLAPQQAATTPTATAPTPPIPPAAAAPPARTEFWVPSDQPSHFTFPRAPSSHGRVPALHIPAPFHTISNLDYSHCAFTGKSLRFAKMMKGSFRRYYEYCNEGSRSEADEHIQILSKREFDKHYPPIKHGEFFGNRAKTGTPGWNLFHARLVAQLAERVEDGDFIAHPFGCAHQQLVHAFPQAVHVETGIGYPDMPFGAYRIYESWAWAHAHWGRWGEAGLGGEYPKGAGPGLNRTYSWVIPNYFDVTEWDVGTGKGNYVLFMGRIDQGKGLDILVAVIDAWFEVHPTSTLEFRFAGQGAWAPYKGLEDRHPGRVKYLGEVSGRVRSKLAGNAIATIMPTNFVEPFGGSGVEGQLCGTPLLAHDAGAFTETVTQGINGFRCHTLGDWLEAIRLVPTLDRARIAADARARYSLETCRVKYERAFGMLAELWSGRGALTHRNTLAMTL